MPDAMITVEFTAELSHCTASDSWRRLLFSSLAAGACPLPAQTLTFSLFERYLESFREQAGIPGLSVAIVQDGAVAWERGLGQQDVEANVHATPDTPYHIGDLSQTFGAALALRKCLEQDTLELSDRVTRWVPDYPDAERDGAQPADSHDQRRQLRVRPGPFRRPHRRDRRMRRRAVPARALRRSVQPLRDAELGPRARRSRQRPRRAPCSSTRSTLARFADVVAPHGPTYRLNGGRPVRSDVSPPALSAATGVHLDRPGSRALRHGARRAVRC